MEFQRGNSYGKMHRFSRENQPKNRGRKPSLYKKLKQLTKKQVGSELSCEDYRAVLLLLLTLTPGELRTLIGLTGERGATMYDTDLPSWIVGVATALLADIRYGRIRTVELILDRVFGQPKQPVVVNSTVKVKMEDFTNMTEDELIAEAKELEKKLR